MKLSRNLLLADGQAIIRSGLRNWFENKFDFIIQEAETIEELKRSLENDSPSIVILDHLTLPNLQLENLIAFLSHFTKTSFLIISGDKEDSSILKILSTGVSGYLTKMCSEAEIVQAVQALSKGEKFFCNKVINLLIEARTKSEDEKGDLTLTDRETEIVKLIAEGNSTMQIASVLNLSHHTINSHRKNILRKLKIKSPVELVVYAINTGLIHPNNHYF